MPKYLCLQRSFGGGTEAAEKPSPAQMQAMYEKFNEWREKFQNNLVDLGGRLGVGRVARPEPSPDGPFVEVKELIGGYMIVSASSLEASRRRRGSTARTSGRPSAQTSIAGRGTSLWRSDIALSQSPPRHRHPYGLRSSDACALRGDPDDPEESWRAAGLLEAGGTLHEGGDAPRQSE